MGGGGGGGGDTETHKPSPRVLVTVRPVTCYGDFCRLLITFANNLNPAQARQKRSVLVWVQTVCEKTNCEQERSGPAAHPRSLIIALLFASCKVLYQNLFHLLFQPTLASLCG